jgi:hypothetical protein
MVHKGVEYQIAKIEPGLWHYEFRIGAVIRTGKTRRSLELLAERRVRSTIDKELGKLASRRLSESASRLRRPASAAPNFSVSIEK